MMVNWEQLGETFLTVTVPVLVLMWRNRQQARKEIEKRHEENISLWNEILTERRFYPSHEHLEKAGPLMAENIRLAQRRDSNGKIK